MKSKHLLLLMLILSLLTLSQSETLNQDDQQYPPLFEDFYLTNKKDYHTFQNLFSVYKQINITSRLIIKSSQKQKQKLIASQSSTLILQKDYLAMYKNKLGFKLKFNLTDQFISALKANQTFVETAFYFLEGSKNRLVEKQLLPVLGEFKHQWREGVQMIVLADMELSEQEEPKKMALKQMDVYLFQIDQQLPFQKDFPGSQTFGVARVQLPNKKPVQYYYPRPLATKINSQLKENYLTIQSLHNTLQAASVSDHIPKFQIKVNLRIGSHLFPLMMQTLEALKHKTQDITLEIDGTQIGLGQSMEVAAPFIIRYCKKVLFEGSILGWVYLFVQTFISFCSKMTSLISIVFEIQIFNKIVQYRGISLYSIMAFITIDILFIILSYGYLETGDFLGPLVSLVIGIWKVKKMARVELFLEYPFVEIGDSPWYQTYSHKDRKSFLQSLLPCSVFVALIVAYPLVFQNYLHSQQSTQQSLFTYTLHRFVLAINEYRFIIAMLPQVLLNYKLKSCNGLPWKLLIVLVWFYSVDNLLVPVSTSVWEVIFYLKEEILLAVLIWQKIFYGNNLDMLPIGEDKKIENDHKAEKEQNNVNQQEGKNVNEQNQQSKIPQTQKLQKKQNLQSEQSNQVIQVQEKPKQQ